MGCPCHPPHLPLLQGCQVPDGHAQPLEHGLELRLDQGGGWAQVEKKQFLLLQLLMEPAPRGQ